MKAISPGTAIDQATIIRRRRQAYVADARLRHHGTWNEQLAKRAYRRAQGFFPGDDGMDDLAKTMINSARADELEAEVA